MCKFCANILLGASTLNINSKKRMVNLRHVILMPKTNMLAPELHCWVSVYMTINGFNLHYPCSIYYYSCELLRPNLSHLAELKSGFKPSGAAWIPVFLQSLFSPSLHCLFSVFLDTVFHFFELSSCCVSFLTRGWLMWVYSTTHMQ